MLSISLFNQIEHLCRLLCSLAIHPDKIKIATGQVAGHDSKEGKVSTALSSMSVFVLCHNISLSVIKYSLLDVFISTFVFFFFA